MAVQRVGEILNDVDKPMAERFRALFTLRGQGGQEAIDQISQSLLRDNSALLKHECAYCLGQMKDTRAIGVLKEVLGNINEDPMVRHEAGEALGAIGDPSVMPFIERYLDDPSPVVAETCQLAKSLLTWKSNKDNNGFVDSNPYLSVDPAPPTDRGSITEWGRELNNSTLSLFERYRALFALRNVGGPEAVAILTTGLRDKSALFKHEIAYVLGQIQDSLAVDALIECLQSDTESAMVRHECAEALGSIATEKCMKVLEEFSQDKEEVVRESCLVALDMYRFEHSNDFQYANLC